MARLKTSHSPLWKELAAQKLRTGRTDQDCCSA